MENFKYSSIFNDLMNLYGRLMTVGIVALLGVSSVNIGQGISTNRFSINPQTDFNVLLAAGIVENLLDQEVPYIANMGPTTCAGTAIRVADNMGIEYVEADAWELPDNNTVVWHGSSTSYKELIRLMRKNGAELRKGDILLFYLPDSSFNQEDRLVTHAATYLGNGKIAYQTTIQAVSRLDDYLIARTDLAFSHGYNSPVEIRFVIRGSKTDNNNDFWLKPMFGSPFYMSVPESDKP